MARPILSFPAAASTCSLERHSFSARAAITLARFAVSRHTASETVRMFGDDPVKSRSSRLRKTLYWLRALPQSSGEP
jgi:hypothetical protein